MRYRPHAMLPIFLLALAAMSGGLCQPANLCPNPGAEEGADGLPAGGWYVEGGKGEGGADQVRSGAHSFKIVWLEDGAIDYLTSGNLEAAQRYRKVMLQNAATPDAKLFNEDDSLHLFFVRQMLSWNLMEGCGVFSDAERLQITNYLLKIARSDQGYGYAGMRSGLYSRENHGTRAARAFYYAWRYFGKYYPAEMSTELVLWRTKLRDFWAACFASSRTFEDSLSQHALGGAMDNILDIGLQEPEWSREFFASGRARQMAERCMAISMATASRPSSAATTGAMCAHMRERRAARSRCGSAT